MPERGHAEAPGRRAGLHQGVQNPSRNRRLSHPARRAKRWRGPCDAGGDDRMACARAERTRCSQLRARVGCAGARRWGGANAW